MSALEELRTDLTAGTVTSDELAKRLLGLSRSYSATLDAAQRDMLQQFDRVITSLVVPDDSDSENRIFDDIAELIAEQRHDEAERALSELDKRDARVRELLADLYFSKLEYRHVVTLLLPCDVDTLQRREVEHLISSCFALSQRDDAKRLLQIHSERFTDAAGKLFRNNIGSRYSAASTSESDDVQ
jgi:hypothetical protein